jgi:hypothetical protein
LYLLTAVDGVARPSIAIVNRINESKHQLCE